MNSNIFNDCMSPLQVSETLGVTLETLSVWRCTKRYPLPYVKIGRKVFYKGEDVNRFIEQRTFNNKEGTKNDVY